MTPYNTTKPTLTPETKAQYVKRYQALKARFEAETGTPDMWPEEIVANLILLRPTLVMSTWRVYKAAVLYVLETSYPTLELAIETLKAESSAGLRKRSDKTSGRKLKQVPEKEWAKLASRLNGRAKEGFKHAQGLLDVLNATLLVGLRPNEWCFSKIVTRGASGRPVLRVRNSKHSNGRGNGEYREMYIDELQANERATIEAALAYCACESPDQAARIQKALRNEFETARSESIAKTRQSQANLSLYSFRHQFMANAKQTCEDPVQIAALSGHSSTKTAFQHYGKRRNGRTQIKVMPTEESVQAVRNARLETYRQPVANRPTLD